MSELEYILLENLSFYDFYSKEQLLLLLDKKVIEQLPDLTMEDLDRTLNNLLQEGHLVRSKRSKEIVWKRVFPKRSFKQKIYNIIMEFYERFNKIN